MNPTQAVRTALLAATLLTACGPNSPGTDFDARPDQGPDAGDQPDGGGDMPDAGDDEPDAGDVDPDAGVAVCTAQDVGVQTEAGAQAGFIAYQAPGGTGPDGGVLTYQLEFYDGLATALTGTHSLSAGIETNYSTCAICVRAFSYDAGGTLMRQFFQSAGSITLAQNPVTTAVLDGSITDLTLVEVTVDETTYVSTPVDGGACVTDDAVTLAAGTVVPPTCTAQDLGVQTEIDAQTDFIAFSAPGGAGPDGGVLTYQLEFYDGLATTLTGTHSLAAGIETNYSTCAICVRALSYDAGGALVRQFFQSAGSITLAQNPAATGVLDGTITDLTLVEVTIDATTYVSTPVADGACIEDDAVTLAEGVVTPTCTTQDLGVQTEASTDVDFIAFTAPGGAGPDGGVLTYQLEFYDGLATALTGTHSLSAGIETNYSTCAICVRAFSYDAGGTLMRQFFQSAGSITLAQNPAATGVLEGTITGLTLVEVTVDATTYVSTPVADGACVTDAAVTLASGTVTPTCTAQDVGPQVLAGSAAGVIYFQADGGVGQDGNDLLYQLEFYDGLATPLTGTHSLSAGIETNYATCAICVRAFSLDAGGNLVRQFFQSGGSLTLNQNPVTTGVLAGTITGLTLVEVTIDGTTYQSTPVAGGACISDAATTLNAQ